MNQSSIDLVINRDQVIDFRVLNDDDTNFTHVSTMNRIMFMIKRNITDADADALYSIDGNTGIHTTGSSDEAGLFGVIDIPAEDFSDLQLGVSEKPEIKEEQLYFELAANFSDLCRVTLGYGFINAIKTPIQDVPSV